MHMDDETDVTTALHAGAQLFAACLELDRAKIKEWVDAGAPLWYSEPDSGWTALHAVTAAEDEEFVKFLLDNSAIWNAVDKSGLTAGDVALSLNNETCYRLIRDAGLRSEFLLRVLQQKSQDPISDDSLVLKTSDNTAAGSSTAFLASHLRFDTDSNGQSVCLATLPSGEEVGVMMGWETELMAETVRLLVDGREQEELHVLNIGFVSFACSLNNLLFDNGDCRGLIDKLFESQAKHPVKHFIIEPHPDVLAHMRQTGWYDKPNVTVLEGKWQDFKESEALYAVGGFDIIYTDTFSEEYGDLLEFFELVPDLLRDPDSRFSFFNGLGATNALFYDVYSNLAELHLSDIGLQTAWSDVELHNDQEVWGETRNYFSLPLYRLPICTMN